MSISTAPASSDLTGPDANRRRRFKTVMALLVGGLGVAATTMLEGRLDPVPSEAWSGSEFGRALAQYRRYAWFDALENQLAARTQSERRDALSARFPTPDWPTHDVPDGLHLAVWLDVEDLTGPDGLWTHLAAKGDAWERPAVARFYRDGDLIVETRAGYRVHGGTGRELAQAESTGLQGPGDFRLYFRNAYDAAPPLASNIWDAGTVSLDRLVAKTGVISGLRNRVALALAERLGVLAPKARFASTSLLGEERSSTLLMEHLSVDWFDRHFGHRDFIFRRLKGGGRRGRGTLYVALEERVNHVASLTLGEVAPLIDMEGLARQYLLTLLTRTQDPFQGLIMLDQRDPGAKWRYVAWDMEGAFPETSPETSPENYPRYLGYPPGQTPILRAVMWRKLGVDPAFQTLMRRNLDVVVALLGDAFLDDFEAKLYTETAPLPEADVNAARSEIARIFTQLRANRDSLADDLERAWIQ